MANKYLDFVTTNIGTATEDYTTFNTEPQRLAGFKSGDPASSRIVNTVLRQANLVACALMDLVAENDQTTDLQSSRSAVKALMSNWLANTANVHSADSSSNVTTQINGKNISSIFDSDGTTAKNALSSITSVRSDGIAYTTTAPTAANPDSSLKVVLLTSEPQTKYGRWIYIITEA